MLNISICFSSHLGKLKNDEFIGHIKNTIGINPKFYEIICLENYNEYSLTQAYNILLDKAKYDIVLFVHNDIKFVHKNWGYVLNSVLENNPEYGIFGKAGTTVLYKEALGCWWMPNKYGKTLSTTMCGQVNHINQQTLQTYTSLYSEFSESITPSVMVDGVFLLVDKNLIKKRFDESYTDYHFYDVSFCIDNFKSGVKIGVINHPKLLITHESVGQVNDKWQENRKKFFQENPETFKVQSIKEKKESYNILITTLLFKSLTGSEIYYYELAKMLDKLGHKVFIYSDTGDIKNNLFIEKIRNTNIELINYNTTQVNSKTFGKYDIDFIIFSHNNLYQLLVTNPYLNKKPIINICHSEIIDIEKPVYHQNVLHYIGIRKSIVDNLKTNLTGSLVDINNDITLLGNPIDFSRFNKNLIKEKYLDKKVYLFVGALDYLRKNAFLDMVDKYYMKENNHIVYVGRNDYPTEINKEQYPNIDFFEPDWEIEKYIKESDVVVGILLGRTSLEGLACGKDSIQYKVDERGEILDIEYVEAKEFPIEYFDSQYTAKRIIDIYEHLETI